MKIILLSIGKNNDPYVQTGVEEFTTRINRYYTAEWKIIPPPRNAASLPEEELKRKEGELILNFLKKDDYLVALDERGTQFTSVELSKFIAARAVESHRQICFVIGGAYGLHEAVLKRAGYKWSLSKLTFPHQLVRLMLAEQVYRACTIARNEKYHHS